MTLAALWLITVAGLIVFIHAVDAHRCSDPDCPACEDAATRAEIERDYPEEQDGPW